MKVNESVDNHHTLANSFATTFERLLAGETLDLYAENVSVIFEVMAANWLAVVPARKWMWYDGVDGLMAKVRKPRQVVFTGAMWVGDGKAQWKAEFRATVTDKRVTKQGIWIVICIGADKVERELLTAFGLTD